MADALPDLPSLAEAGLGLTLLAVLYLRLLMHHRQDRTESRAERAALIKAHKAEVAELRARNTELQQRLDDQLRQTWKAQDAAARYRRQLGLPPTIELGVDGDQQGA